MPSVQLATVDLMALVAWAVDSYSVTRHLSAVDFAVISFSQQRVWVWQVPETQWILWSNLGASVPVCVIRGAGPVLCPVLPGAAVPGTLELANGPLLWLC